MSEWQKIETAPKDGTPVLLAGPYIEHPSIGAWNYDEWHGHIDGRTAYDDSAFGASPATLYKPTHWMPLPPPPKD